MSPKVVFYVLDIRILELREESVYCTGLLMFDLISSVFYKDHEIHDRRPFPPFPRMAVLVGNAVLDSVLTQ